MYERRYSTKEVGETGEKAVAEYLRRLGFAILGRNIRTSFGELDIVAEESRCLHLIEVKTRTCAAFPTQGSAGQLEPWENLHQQKIRKVARMAEWYVDRFGWRGEWQVDGALVWLRSSDNVAKVSYYPQIL